MGVRLQQKPRTWHLDFESPTPGGLPSPWPPGVLQADKETEAGLYVQRPTLNPTTTGHRPPSPTSLCPLRPPPRQTAEYSTRGLGVDLGESRLTQWLPGPDHTANQWQSRARRGPVGSRSHLDTTLPRLLAIRGRAVQSLSSALLCLGPCGPVRRASPGGVGRADFTAHSGRLVPPRQRELARERREAFACEHPAWQFQVP